MYDIYIYIIYIYIYIVYHLYIIYHSHPPASVHLLRCDCRDCLGLLGPEDRLEARGHSAIHLEIHGSRWIDIKIMWLTVGN